MRAAGEAVELVDGPVDEVFGVGVDAAGAAAREEGAFEGRAGRERSLGAAEGSAGADDGVDRVVASALGEGRQGGGEFGVHGHGGCEGGGRPSRQRYDKDARGSRRDTPAQRGSRAAMSSRPKKAAISRAERPPASGSAPWSSRSCTDSAERRKTAAPSAVWPRSLMRSGSAPCSRSMRTVSGWEW